MKQTEQSRHVEMDDTKARLSPTQTIFIILVTVAIAFALIGPTLTQLANLVQGMDMGQRNEASGSGRGVEEYSVADSSDNRSLFIGPNATAMPAEEGAAITQKSDALSMETQEEADSSTSKASPVPATVGSTGDSLQQPGTSIMTPQEYLLQAAHLTIAANDEFMVSVLKQKPMAVGFVGQGIYRAERQNVRQVRLDMGNGQIVAPRPDTIFQEVYPISRLLYLYTSVEAIQENADVAAFIGCYLGEVNDEILDIGFFPVRQTIYNETLTQYHTLTGAKPAQTVPRCTVDGLPGDDLALSGSTTMAPLTGRMIEVFEEQGFPGTVTMDAAGSGAGIERFCRDGVDDIISSDRPLTAEEIESCMEIGREPVGFAVGEDAISVIVNEENDFIDSVTMDELRQLFSTAILWSDVRPEWPAESIERVTPSAQGGTFATFADRVFGAPASTALTAGLSVSTQTTLVSAAGASEQSSQIENAVVENSIVENAVNSAAETEYNTEYDSADDTIKATNRNALDILLPVVTERATCLWASQLVQEIVQQEFGLRVHLEAHNSMSTLYTSFAGEDADVANRATLCYADPMDRDHLLSLGGWLILMGDGYQEADLQRWYIATESHLANQLNYTQPCLYEFFENFSLPTDVDQTVNPTVWLQENPVQVAEWLSCTATTADATDTAMSDRPLSDETASADSVQTQ